MELTEELRACRLIGAPNARDLGGLPTTDGRTVKRGRLIRSGSLWRLTESDIVSLREMRLRTVVDFRSDREISEKPDLPIPDAEWIHCPILPQLTGVTRELDEDGVPSYFRMAMTIGMDAENWMAGLYLPLVESDYSREHYRAFFRLLLQPRDGALLYHCTVGKDRVGVGTMLLLSALGVDRDAIMQDYLLTNVYTARDREKTCAEMLQYTSDPAAQFAMEAFESVRERYLNNAYCSIEEGFGSVEHYLREVLLIGDVERGELRRLYLA